MRGERTPSASGFTWEVAEPKALSHSSASVLSLPHVLLAGLSDRVVGFFSRAGRSRSALDSGESIGRLHRFHTS